MNVQCTVYIADVVKLHAEVLHQNYTVFVFAAELEKYTVSSQCWKNVHFVGQIWKIFVFGSGLEKSMFLRSKFETFTFLSELENL